MARKSRKNEENVAIEQAIISNSPAYRVGAYVRLSKVDKKHKGDSIETQQAIIKAFISLSSDMELTECYIDNGETGTNVERAAFQKMLTDIESGKINCCVTKDLSRLGRSAIDTGFYIGKYFPNHGVRYVAITDNYDSANDECGGIMVALKNMVNESFALEIGRKIRETKQYNIRHGAFVGRIAPYGYQKDPKDNHKLIIDPETAPIVRKIFDMVATGEGVTAVSNWLNDNGILPYKKYLFTKSLVTAEEAATQRHWNKGVIYSILRNQTYCGDMVQGKHRTFQYDQKKLPKEKWITVENTHEPLVSRELFAKIAEMFNTGNPPKAPVNRTNNIFLRKMYCGHCGLTIKRMKLKNSAYFQCNTQQAYHESDCVVVKIDEAELTELLFEFIKRQAVVFSELKAKPKNFSEDTYKAELIAVQAELNKVKNFHKGLYESLVIGDISETDYKEMKQNYEEKLLRLQGRECNLREKYRNETITQAELMKTAENFELVSQISDINVDLVDKMIERILVFEDKHIAVTFRYADVLKMLEVGTCG